MSTSSTHKVVAGAVVAVVLGIGALAVAAGAGEWSSEDPTTTTTEAASTTEGASTPEAPSPPDEQPPAPEADEDGAHPGGRPGFLDEVLGGLVEDGTLTQEQADAVAGGVQEKVDEWREAHPRPELPGKGGRGPAGPPRGGPGFPGLDDAIAAAAEVIGVEPDALRDGLRDGRSVAEIAADAGVDRQTLIDAIVAEATEVLDGAVADGHIDADRAASLEEHLPEWVERTIDLHRPR